jgi:hypothetical protein
MSSNYLERINFKKHNVGSPPVQASFTKINSILPQIHQPERNRAVSELASGKITPFSPKDVQHIKATIEKEKPAENASGNRLIENYHFHKQYFKEERK